VVGAPLQHGERLARLEHEQRAVRAGGEQHLGAAGQRVRQQVVDGARVQLGRGDGGAAAREPAVVEADAPVLGVKVRFTRRIYRRGFT